MKRRIISLFLACALFLNMVPAVFAADHGIADIVGHWAEEDVLWVMDMGLFNGTSDTTFDPNGTMTRGMFVTVLGRYAGIDPMDYEDWYLPDLFEDVNADFYYAPYINWAVRHGITKGTGAGTFSPDTPITREQMAVFLVRFAQGYGYLFEPIREDVADSFADQGEISGFATEAVEVMRQSGLLTGRLNAAGTFDFDPQARAARSECAAVFHRLFDSMVIDESFEFVEPENIGVACATNQNLLMPGDRFALEYHMEPADPSNQNVLWVSSDPDVATVDSDGVVQCMSLGTAEIYAYTCNGLFDYYTVEVEPYIGYAGESYESKCMHLFGRVVDDPRHPYTNHYEEEEYVENLVTVKVKVWNFKNGIGSEKVTKTWYIEVHKNLAPTVEALFAELYACEEQYPINSLGGYRWSNKSEHTPGLAIDVNPKQNPYVDPDGKVLVGEKFDPENNPYSFEVGGEVEQIFNKYGFTRGIYWKSGYKDYMHFSFFGT